MATPPDDEVRAALSGVRLLALDVDGTLTAGQVVYVGSQESQSFCVRDGQGLVWLRDHGVAVAWITGRGSSATERRANELGVAALRMRSGPKAEVLADVQRELGVSVAETVAMGDDLPDLALARHAALLVAPADAHPVVRRHAALVTEARGGAGAVRELCEHVLRAKGLWDEVVARHLGSPGEIT